MGVEVIPAPDLSTAEIKTLCNLSLRSEGKLAETLRDWRWTDRALVLRISDKDGRVLSWGLLSPHYADRMDFMLYTRASERRKGHGSALMQKALALVGDIEKMVVHPHAEPDIAFFKKFGYTWVDSTAGYPLEED